MTTAEIEAAVSRIASLPDDAQIAEMIRMFEALSDEQRGNVLALTRAELQPK
jgi:hypothetical protein